MAKACSTKGPRLLRVGVIGSVVAVLCCATPLLVILMGAVSLGWLTGYLGYVVLPALVVFPGLTAYALWRDQQTTGGAS